MPELQQMAAALGIKGARRMRKSQLISAISDAQKRARGESRAKTAALPVTIYISDEAAHREVESAVEEVLRSAGLRIVEREDPILGSWFRRMRAAVGRVARSEVVREGALTAAHVADTRLVLAQDATITSTMLLNLGPVITALQPTKDAVLRIGALLIVKVDWTVSVFQLTAAQQAVLDHQPKLATSPQDVIKALELPESSAPSLAE
ncbi:Rho termination factor N-terminal domain-containing protein [Streptomyces mayteni]